MQVLFLTHYFPPEGNAPASRVHEICKRWVKAGWKVTVITGVPNCPMGVVYPGYRNKLSQREEIDGIDVRRVWTYVAANKGTFLRTLNYVSYMSSALSRGLSLPRPDVLIATSPQFFCGWAGVGLHAFRRIPFILEIRDIWPESIVAVGAVRQQGIIRALEWAEKKMYRSANHIVTVGPGYQAELLQRGVADDKISVIPNGVDQEIFSPRPCPETLRAQYGLQNRFVCAYVGTVGMACGLGVVLQAAQLLKARGDDRISFLIVGDGAVKEDLEQQARQLQLDNVVFTGRQDKALVPDYLALADACLVHLRKARLFESVLPSKIFEAAAMARPIILGVKGYAAELLNEVGAGLTIEPGNAEQLTEAVMRLAGDAEQARAFGQAGYDQIVQRFNRERLAQEYMAVVERVVQENRKT